MVERVTVSDGSTWPRPAINTDPHYGVSNRLRYGKPTRADLLEAAEIADAYGHLVLEATQMKRGLVVRELRASVLTLRNSGTGGDHG